MENFFKPFWDQRGGILVFLICAFFLLNLFGRLLRTLARTFQFGEYKSGSPSPGRNVGSASDGLTFTVVNFFAKLISDFRHLLALLLVLIFAATLFYAIYTVQPADAEGVAKAIQGVMATLGGLVGSIVGYYFGESAGRKTDLGSGPATSLPNAGDLQQSLPAPTDSAATPSVTAAPPPPPSRPLP